MLVNNLLRNDYIIIYIIYQKVNYIHDGTETRKDFAIFELELRVDESRFALPIYLQGRHRFALHFNITPVNDPPVLFVNKQKTFQMAQVSIVIKILFQS